MELYRHLKEIFETFRKELRTCLAADSPNKIKWEALFEDSQRELSRKLTATPIWTLSVKWVVLPQPPLGQVHDESSHGSDPYGETSSAILPLGETQNSPHLNSTWNGPTVTASPPMVPTPTYDELPIFFGGMNETEDLNFNQNIDMVDENSTNSHYLYPGNLEQDYLGDLTYVDLALNLLPGLL